MGKRICMFNNNKAFFIGPWLWLLLVFSTARSQTTNDTSMGLKDLLYRVGKQSSFLMSDSAAILIKLAQQNAAKYNALPTFTLNLQGNLGTNNNLPGGYFSYGIVPGNSRVRNEGSDATILTDLAIASVNYTIYDFGERREQRKVAASDVSVEQLRFNQKKYDLEAYVIDTYLQWLQIEDLLAIQTQNIDRTTEIRQSIMALAKSGIKAGVDTSIAEAEISRLRSNYLELDGQRQQLKIILAAITNTPEEQLRADTTYSSRLIAQSMAAALNDSNNSQHPILQYYQSLYQNSKQKAELVKKSFYPTISLQGAVWGRGSSVSARDEFRALGKGLGLERGNYLVGVGITYDLFDIKRRQLQMRTQEEVTNYANQQYKEKQLLLNLNESKLNARLVTMKQKLLEIPNQLAAAQAAYRQKLSLYKNGLINIVELNIALSVLYRAETDLIAAKYMYCKTLFEKAINSNQVQTLL
jgi:outer membrane protein, adhesin transport system